MLLYLIAIHLYALGVTLASPFSKKARQMIVGRLRTFRTLKEKVAPGARYVWFHAASLGEFEQGRPLIERIKRERPGTKVLLTFFSPSGYEVRKNYPMADIVCYLPFDTVGNILSFFRYVRPEAAYFIKYEFWATAITYCHFHNIPVYSISSIFRPKQVFFRWYGRGYASVLRSIEHFFVQDEQSQQLLIGIGIEPERVSVTGDTRFDRVIDIQSQAREQPLVGAFAQGHKVLVCGSTWPPCEELIANHFNRHPELRLIVAPHVVSEAHLRQIEALVDRPTLRLSEATEENVSSAECLIVDCYGLLSSLYRYGQVAYVGGGFGHGIHNVPEAAVYGVPVVIGPRNAAFREAQDLLRLGACLEVTDQATYDRAIDSLYADDAKLQATGRIAYDYIHRNAGATDAICQHLQKH